MRDLLRPMMSFCCKLQTLNGWPGGQFSLFQLVVLCWAATARPQLLDAQDVYFERHEGAVRDVRTIKATPYVVSGGSDATVRIWNRQTADEVQRYDGHTAPVHSVAVSPNAQLLASGGQDNTVRLWPAPVASADRTWTLANDAVQQLVLSPVEQSNFALCGRRLWKLEAAPSDTASDLKPQAIWSADAEVTAWHARSDGVLHYIGTGDGRVIVYSPILQSTLGEWKACEHAVRAVSNCGEDVFVIDVRGHGSRWKPAIDTQNKQNLSAEQVSEFIVTQDPMFQLQSASGGSRWIILAGQQLKILSVDGRELSSRAVPVGERLLAVSPDAQQVVLSRAAGGAVQYSLAGDTAPDVFATEEAADLAAYTSDGRRLATVSKSGTVSLFGPPISNANGPWHLQQKLRTAQPATALAFADSGETLWVGHPSGQLAQWRCSVPRQIRQLSAGGAVYSTTFTPDGRFLLAAGADQTIRIWLVENGQQRFQMRGHQGSIYCVIVQHDGALAYSSGADGTIRVWDIVSGRQIRQLTTLPATMYSLLIDPQGRYLLAAGGDRRIYQIDLSTGETMRTLEGHQDYIHRLCWLKPGSRLLSYGYGGSLRIWDVNASSQVGEHQFGQVGNAADVALEAGQIVLATGQAGAIVLKVP